MAPLKFVDTHNMVAYLSKSDASAGFDQIMDFLNAHTIQYAWVVNPTIYVFYSIPTPPQAQPATPYTSPPQEQPSSTTDSSMSLLTTLMETCATLSQKFAELEQDKHTQALEILKLKKRVKKLGKKKKLMSSGFKRLRKGRIDQDVSAATKDVRVVEPTVFANEEEIKKAVARYKQEKDDLERAQMLQKQYDDKEENIDWNAIAEKIQQNHLDNIMKYQSLKRKPVSIAQAKKSMIINLKNMVGYKMEHFRVPNVDKEKSLWVELKRLIEPNADDVLWKLQSDEDLHGGQQTKERKFGYILQVIKMINLKKLDVLLAKVDAVQRLKENALRD
nr:hypothetical protein [Tanacetum cinerariifolium]